MHRPALIIMLRWVHRNEHLQNHVGFGIDNGDRRLRRKSLRIALDRDDVLVASDGPERASRAIGLIMDGALLTESSKEFVPIVVLEHAWIGNIQILERHRTIVWRCKTRGHIHIINLFNMLQRLS